MWSSFVAKLEYKSEWSEKIILMIGKFEPSSRLCHFCGYHNSELTLIKIENGNVLIAKQKMREILMLQLTSKKLILLIKI